MKLGDFVIYCGRVFLVSARGKDGKVDIESLNGTRVLTLEQRDIEEMTKANCWYKGCGIV